jgi:hypothetical protein
MKYTDNENMSHDQRKWSECTLKPKKQPRRLTDYVSMAVIGSSVAIVSGLPEYLAMFV